MASGGNGDLKTASIALQDKFDFIFQLRKLNNCGIYTCIMAILAVSEVMTPNDLGGLLFLCRFELSGLKNVCDCFSGLYRVSKINASKEIERN